MMSLYYRNYYKKNKEKYKISVAKYQQSAKGKKKIKEYRKKNKKRINKWHRSYEKKRKLQDPTLDFKRLLLGRLRKRILRHLKNIPEPTNYIKKWDKNQFDEYQQIILDIGGIDYEKIIKHLKPIPKDFAKNYQVDHIKPMCLFDFNKAKDIKKCFSPENLQILTIQQNRKKGKKFP